jgi:hypothetical protein
MAVPSPLAYWPGDINSAYLQTLAYDTSTNTLSLQPFGNSVVLSFDSETISSIVGVSTIQGDSITIQDGSGASIVINQNTTNFNNTVVNIGSTLNVSQTINSSTINASTINVQNLSTTEAFISSINGYNIHKLGIRNESQDVLTTTSTIGGTPTEIYNFNTLIPGNWYRVNAVIGAQVVGGGNAGDYADVYLRTTNAILPGSNSQNQTQLMTLIQNNINPIYPTKPFYNMNGLIKQDESGSNVAIYAQAYTSSVWEFDVGMVTIENLGGAVGPPIPPNW